MAHRASSAFRCFPVRTPEAFRDQLVATALIPDRQTRPAKMQAFLAAHPGIRPGTRDDQGRPARGGLRGTPRTTG